MRCEYLSLSKSVWIIFFLKLSFEIHSHFLIILMTIINLEQHRGNKKRLHTIENIPYKSLQLSVTRRKHHCVFLKVSPV